MLINTGPSSNFTLLHIAKYFQIFHISFLDCFESFVVNRGQQNVLSVKLQISSLFETQMAWYRVIKRIRLVSSVYLLLSAFLAITVLAIKRNRTMLATVLQVVLYRFTRCWFVQYNWQEWLNLDWLVPAGKTTAHYGFIATCGLPRSVSCTITMVYDAWKTFIHESKFRSIAKFTADKVTRGETLTYLWPWMNLKVLLLSNCLMHVW